jgi:AraC family transcriptional regulator
VSAHEENVARVGHASLAVGIAPEEVVKFAPGKILAEASAGSGEHRRVFYREFSYEPSTVNAPGIDALLMVVYREGRTTMRRRVEGGWQERVIEPGAISILGQARPSEWEWGESIGVSHLYLLREFMADTAARAFDQDLERFNPADALKIEDPTLLALADTLAGELRRPGPASNLLVDSVAQALCLHTLRAHHRCDRPVRNDFGSSGLTPSQRRRAIDFIEVNLCQNFRMVDLAQATGLNEAALLREFKLTFGDSPYQYVLARRVERASDLIRTTNVSLAEIAYAAGFSDQSHMTRLVKRATGLTPKELRRG